MTLQREPGKSHEPMRKRLVTLDMASDENLQSDTTGAATWTTANCELPVRQLNKYMDIEGQNILVSSAAPPETIRLRKGLWRFRLCLEVNKSVAVDGGVAFAICNADGTTVHKEWDPIDSEDEIGRSTYVLEYVHKVTTPTETFTIRGLRRNAGFTATLDAAYIGSVQKIANDKEAREE